VHEIFQLAEQLENQFKSIKPNLKEVLPQDSWVQIRFQITPTEIGIYRLKQKEVIYTSNGDLSNCAFRVLETYIISNGKESERTKLSRKIFEAYHGLKDAYEKIFDFNKKGRYSGLAVEKDYLDAISIEENGIPIPIKSKI
jgi:hypothetical protein